MPGKRFRAIALIIMAAAGLGAARHDALHLRLVRSEPAQDAVLASSPGAVHLWYSEEPQLKLTTVELSGPDGSSVKLENIAAVEGDAMHLTAAVDAPLAAGAWSVAWRTLARDGHVVRGTIGFRVGTAP